MKTITKSELKSISYKHEMRHDEETNSIFRIKSGKKYGFEATEVDGEELSGFRFFGNLRHQAEVLQVWNELTGEKTDADVLTIERAKELIGKIVEFEYKEHTKCKFRIIRLENKVSKQIGQNSHCVLVVNDCVALEYHNDNTVTWSEPANEEMFYPYEWQGVFRVTGSASPLRVYEICE